MIDMAIQTTVYEKGPYKIVKDQSYGWKSSSNTLYTSWEIYEGDKLRGVFMRLKDAKAWVQGHTTNLKDLIDNIQQMRG